MQRSTERLLTTHAGSLPRPEALRDLLIARDEGRPYDQAIFSRRVGSAVAEVVQWQLASGIGHHQRWGGLEAQLFDLRARAALVSRSGQD
jgi:methionine synthase II (cobalamin-independent)